ncbi:uncharacterized protein BX664DRAFT_342566 [Halteromyces radiatus]|uniref:uncharacterized protein n=1 Tax=Halteromyces radiatus TaxID=101107 RepID=UPI002220C293|nr:uncharacterized protein BX664DRAFT_342566 [Halteromyces radiatus]KAI8078727.1 hypothetical protein BX664DRAFT_342566 [Halteromyces radiatus]
MIISSGIANITCISFTLLYIAGFYLFEETRSNGLKLSRQHPTVIKSRMKAVTLSCCVILFLVYIVLSYSLDQMTFSTFLTRLGCQPIFLWNLLQPLVLTMVLFLGPLTILYFDQQLPGQVDFYWKRDVMQVISSLYGQRNYVFAPLTEELVFRSCMIVILYQAGYSYTWLIFISPLYFGLAHLHHGWEVYHQMGRTKQALQTALVSSFFQFGFTSLFGWYASFIFLRTSSLWTCVLCHSFCNMMGFPDINDIPHRPDHHRYVIWSSFLIGILSFVYLLYPLTCTTNSFYWSCPI